MFGSGKRQSVVEYTHRKCLTTDISMVFFCQCLFNFSFYFLSSPLLSLFLPRFFSFAEHLVGFIFVQGCRQHSSCRAYVISRRGIVQLGSSFCFIIFLLFPMKGKISSPRVLVTAVLVGKAFGNAYRTLGLDERRGSSVQRKSCPIAQGQWNLLSGSRILFLTFPPGK